MRRGAPSRYARDRHLSHPGVPNVIHQVTQVVALFYMGPGVYAIFIRSSVIFTALLALIFFPKNATSFANGNSRSAQSSD